MKKSFRLDPCSLDCIVIDHVTHLIYLNESTIIAESQLMIDFDHVVILANTFQKIHCESNATNKRGHRRGIDQITKFRNGVEDDKVFHFSFSLSLLPYIYANAMPIATIFFLSFFSPKNTLGQFGTMSF